MRSLADNYGDCGNTYEDLRYEILSLAEMEVCVTSSTFFYSFGSSWSFNVQTERAVLNKGLTILVRLSDVSCISKIFLEHENTRKTFKKIEVL